MKVYEMERIHKEFMTLLGVGYDQRIGEYWDVLSQYDGKHYHATTFHLRRLIPLIQEYGSAVRLIELPNEQYLVTLHNLSQWNRRITVVSYVLTVLIEMEKIVFPLRSETSIQPDWNTLLSLSRSGCTLPGKTVEERLQYWVTQARTSGIRIERRPFSKRYNVVFTFTEECTSNEKALKKTYRISTDDILDLELMLTNRLLALFREWIKRSVLSLRACNELDTVLEKEEMKILYSHNSRFSAKQLSNWMDKAGKTIPQEALDEWYDWETEGA